MNQLLKKCIRSEKDVKIYRLLFEVFIPKN